MSRAAKTGQPKVVDLELVVGDPEIDCGQYRNDDNGPGHRQEPAEKPNQQAPRQRAAAVAARESIVSMEEPSRRFEKTVAASSTLLRVRAFGSRKNGLEAAHLLGPEILRDTHENGLAAEVEPVAQGLDDLEIGDGRDGPGRAVVVDETVLSAGVHVEQGMDEPCLPRVFRNIGRAPQRVEDGRPSDGCSRNRSRSARTACCALPWPSRVSLSFGSLPLRFMSSSSQGPR